MPRLPSSQKNERRRRIRPLGVQRVCEALESAYGRPRLGNPEDPLDDLIYVIVSNRTSPDSAQHTFSKVKESFASWDEIIRRPVAALRSLLKPAGLSKKKARQIRGALRQIRKDFGACNLSQLFGKSVGEVQEYLVALPGVSDKVARCVMMYTLGAEVLPVDVHVHRITRRLGWTAKKRADQCHEELDALVSPEQRYAFHVDCIVHGRTVCRPSNPACNRCCIKRYCAYFESHR